MTYFQSQEKADCFGCGACAQACPAAAITMAADEEGFLYPCVDSDACVHCGRCAAVCPADLRFGLRTPERVAAGYSRQSEIQRSSASGGAFWAITMAAPEDAIIFGAEWTGRSTVCHRGAPKWEAYERFHKSKYIQSEIGSSYVQAKRQLKQGRTVVFTGTPCQIAGLKAFIGGNDPNLLCVDLVCHGVPSGKVLEAYLQDAETPKDPVRKIEFRYKKPGKDRWDSKCAKLIYNSGKERIVDYDSSAFLRGFAAGLFFRPSCSSCPYARKERISDLTIGDCWGIENRKPEWDPHKGVSLVFANTGKGKQWLQRMEPSMVLEEISLDQAVSGNARLRDPDSGHKNRSDFFNMLEKESFERLVQSFVPRISRLRKLGHRIKQKLRK